MKAIILSAGRGTRMMPLTKNTPKCLLPLENGSTVLESQLEAIQKSGKISEVAIVVGYLSEQIETKIKTHNNKMKIKTVYNPFYDCANNLISLWSAHHEMDNDFVIINGDNVFHESVIEKVMEDKPDGIYVTIDKLKDYTEDDMKVQIKDNKIIFINKKIPVSETNGESIGIIRIKGKKFVDACRNTILDIVRKPEARDIFWLEVFNELVRRNFNLIPVEISEEDWCEVDFHADLKILKKRVLKFGWNGFSNEK